MTTTAPALSHSGWDVCARAPARERVETGSSLTAEALDSIFEAAPTPMAYLDCDFNFVRVNQAYATALGATSAELTGQQYFARYPDAQIQSLFYRLRDKGESSAADLIPISYFVGSARDRVSWNWRLTPIKNATGAVAGLLLTLWNATIEKCPSEPGMQPQQLLHTLLDAIPLGVYWKDRELRYQGCNARFAADVGVGSVSELIGKCDSDLPGSWGSEPKANDRGDAEDSAPKMVAYEELVTTLDGRQVWLRRSEIPLFGETGDMVGMFGFYEDISERKRIGRNLQLAHTAINKSKTCIHWIDAQGQIFDVNDYACEILGYTREEMIGLQIADFDPDFVPADLERIGTALKEQGSLVFESRHRRKDGTIFPVEVTLNKIRFGDEEYAFSFVQDISERKDAEEKIRRLAFFDPLTELPNRRLLMDRLHLELAASARTQTYGAVLFVDLDNFKNLNDKNGHDVGDLLLLEVSRRLQSTVREGDTVARLGGDEFVMILPALSSNRDYATSLATAVADRALQELCHPCSLRDHEYNTSCSIGISLFSGQRDAIEKTLSRADTAMYEAKKAGRNTYRLFDPSMQYASESRTRRESRLRGALFRRQSQIH